MERKDLEQKLFEIDVLSSDFLAFDDPAFDEIDKVTDEIRQEIKNASEERFEEISKRIDAIIKGIDYKYGYTSMILDQILEFQPIKKNINERLDLTKSYINKSIEEFSAMINECLKSINSFDFLINPYENQHGKEGLKLSLDSIKTILENKSYQVNFPSKDLLDYLTDYMKLSKKESLLDKIQKEYKEGIQKIWESELTNSKTEDEKFTMLVSMITGRTSEDITFQVNNLINRPNQSSCSLISDDFIATYMNGNANIGLIYPSDSKIITCGYKDLGSNVFGEGIKNKECASQMATPKALIENGKVRAIRNGEDLKNSISYNEVLIDGKSKPCGIVLLTKNQELSQDDIVQAKLLASNLGLPLTQINTISREKQIEQTGISR